MASWKRLETRARSALVVVGPFCSGMKKQQPGQNILVYGSADLVDTLMQPNLIDEYRLMIFPIVLGIGKRLFKEGSSATLKLVETQTFSSGVVVLSYQPERKE